MVSLRIIRRLALAVLFLVLATGQAPASTLLTLGSGFNGPNGVAVDSQGDVFVADTNDNQIKEIVAVDGIIPASPAILTLGGSFVFSGPQDVALDGSGNLFVADTGNGQIEELTLTSGYASPPAGQVFGAGTLSQPVGITVDAHGNVFAADQANNAVYELPAPSYSTVETLGGGWGMAGGVAVDASGDVFVADLGAIGQPGALWEILAANAVPFDKTPPTQLALDGPAFGGLQGIGLDAAANVYVADVVANVVYEVPATGGYMDVNTVATGFNIPVGIDLDRFGNIYVANAGSNSVQEIQFQVPVSAPTLGQGALILFFLLLAGTGLRFGALGSRRAGQYRARFSE